MNVKIVLKSEKHLVVSDFFITFASSNKGDMEIKNGKIYTAYVGGNGEIEITLSGKAVNEICTAGSNDAAVEKWCKLEAEQFLAVSDEALKRELHEVWDDASEIDKADRLTNVHRALWTAAWNIKEGNYFGAEYDNE